MNHIISVLVENQPGVLARVIGLISGRGFNIDSLNVAPTQDVSLSRITMTVPGDDRVLEQITKQLNKLVDVVKVFDLTGEPYVERELALVKVNATAKTRAAVVELASLFGGRIVSVRHKVLIIQLVGTPEDADNFIDLLRPHGIIEVSRTGVIALGKAEGRARNDAAGASNGAQP